MFRENPFIQGKSISSFFFKAGMFTISTEALKYVTPACIARHTM
jgi:hypothetical protein